MEEKKTIKSRVNNRSKGGEKRFRKGLGVRQEHSTACACVCVCVCLCLRVCVCVFVGMSKELGRGGIGVVFPHTRLDPRDSIQCNLQARKQTWEREQKAVFNIRCLPLLVQNDEEREREREREREDPRTHAHTHTHTHARTHARTHHSS